MPKHNKIWQTSQRSIDYSGRTLVMGVLNVTPDSFSDGGEFERLDDALQRADEMIAQCVDIIDIGGESTRPGGIRVSATDEIRRTAPVIDAIRKRFDIPVSIDTSKSEVATEAINAGAEIINDVSGLVFDREIGTVAAKQKSGLILMHLRGEFETMHKLAPVSDIISEVSVCFDKSIVAARKAGVGAERICLDVGIGFGKTFDQNLELIAKLGELCEKFERYPMLVGTSRKSFIGKILGDVPANERLSGTIATNILSVLNGANIIRVHDVKANIDAIRVAEEITAKF